MVREISYSRFPIPQGVINLEIPMTVNVMIGDEPTNVYEKMLSFIPAYYLEPDKIPPT